MLPTPLVGAYQQYKADTDAVAAWLASTASAHGYFLTQPQDAETTSSKAAVTGRLKGKARKDAKRAAENQGQVHRTYRIAIRDFVVLAEHIASKNVSVPFSFASTLDRLIRVRQSFGRRLEKHGSLLNESLDRNHSFFVSILESVRETLRPWFQMSPQTSDPTEPTDRLGEATNRFARLFVHEPSEHFLDAPDTERPKPALGDTAVYQAERLITAREAQMAFLLVMDDLNHIRHRLDWIWENYKNKVFDLITSAIATNTAVELARNIIDGIVPLIEATGGLENCINMTLGVQLQQASEPYTQSDYENNTETDPGYPYVHHKHYRLSVDTYYSAYSLVDRFRENTRHNKMVTFTEKVLPYAEDSDRATKTGDQQYAEDEELLAHFLVEVKNMEITKVRHQVCDEIIHGMREMHRTGDIPFHLVFTAQVFLDIHQTLRSDVRRAFDTLETNLNHMRVDMVQHLELHGSTYASQEWMKAAPDFMSETIRSIDRALADPLYEVRAKSHLFYGWEVPDTKLRNKMLKMSPVLSGLVLFSFTIKYQTYGLQVEQYWKTVMCAAHLHNALHSEKLVTTKWHDMMMVRALFEDSNFFVGSPPTTPQQYFSRFHLRCGVSATLFSTNPRLTSRPAVARKPRKIQIADIAPVSNLFLHRLIYSTGPSKWTAEIIDQVNKLSRYQYQGKAPTGLAFTNSEDLSKFLEINQTLLDSKTRRRPNRINDPEITPDQVIFKLVHVLNNEKLSMAFPWLKMHRSCWNFLQAIKPKADESFHQQGSGSPLLRNWVLPWIFVRAKEGDMSLMQVVADIARDHYKSSGSETFQELTERGLSISVVIKDQQERKEYEKMFPSGFCPPGVHGNFLALAREL
ncbi:hypothetical protein PFICI_03582 [Pestalotiopsis fici W106-1]|uniref:DUF6604 domain-containing protein n=1 Tax=Pestalotiopsis fici (strain W106-1 / CGMCC3.15140) TaxID=1229662 RepID=W3XJC2_PESFW|nr:uncharacterized protein PFICI_03582 [Pestalotiopsis fici W106-1]ETS85557.1 hypothetical protein PFICI_03582 [Pestalotiopsis fici W106-1]